VVRLDHPCIKCNGITSDANDPLGQMVLCDCPKKWADRQPWVRGVKVPLCNKGVHLLCLGHAKPEWSKVLSRRFLFCPVCQDAGAEMLALERERLEAKGAPYQTRTKTKKVCTAPRHAFVLQLLIAVMLCRLRRPSSCWCRWGTATPRLRDALSWTTRRR
jgi:hypothetical protein